MLTYSVGPEEFSDGELEPIAKGDPLWLVYWYEKDSSGGGDGIAIAFRRDGLLDYNGLRHGCGVGPLDDWADEGSDKVTVTVDNFAVLSGKYMCAVEKARSLLNL